MATLDVYLPPDEDLTVEEVNLSSPALRAGAFHFGKYCENQSNVSLNQHNPTSLLCYIIINQNK